MRVWVILAIVLIALVVTSVSSWVFGWAVILAGALAVPIYRAVRARSIVRRRSEQLSAITGVPADVIRNTIIARQITPGEWAAEQGLDPITFEPRAW